MQMTFLIHTPVAEPAIVGSVDMCRGSRKLANRAYGFTSALVTRSMH